MGNTYRYEESDANSQEHANGIPVAGHRITGPQGVDRRPWYRFPAGQAIDRHGERNTGHRILADQDGVPLPSPACGPDLHLLARRELTGGRGLDLAPPRAAALGKRDGGKHEGAAAPRELPPHLTKRR